MYEMSKEDIHYVEWTARKFFRARGFEPGEDEMQRVLEVVVKGAKHYNPDRGVKFISYAHPWIKKAVSRLVTKTRISIDTGLPIAEGTKTDISYQLTKSKIPIEDLKVKQRDFRDVYEDIDLVRKTITHFPEKLQDVLIRHYFNGEKYIDLYKETGCTSGKSLSAVVGQWCRKVGKQLEDEVT